MKLTSISGIKALFFENRSVKQTLVKNAFWLSVAEIASKALTYIVMAVIAQHFGSESYGKFAFAFSFVAIFIIFSDFGFSTLTVRELSRDKSKASQYIDNIVAIKLVLGLIVFCLIAVIAHFLQKDDEVLWLIYLVGAYNVIISFITFFHSIFQANEKMEYETLGRVSQQVFLLILVLFFIYKGSSIVAMGYSYVTTAFFSIIFYLFLIRKYFVKFLMKVDFKICLEILKETWPFGLIIIFGTLYHQIDMVMLGFMKGYSAAGFYSVAQWLPRGLLIFPLILNGAIFPKMSYFHKVSKDSLDKLHFSYFKYMSIFGIFLGIFIMMFGGVFMDLLFGQEYAPSKTALNIYIWSTVLIFINSAFTNLFAASGKQILLAKICGSAVVLNLALNLALIPKYSFVGASISAVISELFITALVIANSIKNRSKK